MVFEFELLFDMISIDPCGSTVGGFLICERENFTRSEVYAKSTFVTVTRGTEVPEIVQPMLFWTFGDRERQLGTDVVLIIWLKFDRMATLGQWVGIVIRNVVSEGNRFVGLIVIIILLLSYSTWVGSAVNVHVIAPIAISIPFPESDSTVHNTVDEGLMNLTKNDPVLPASKGLLIPSISSI